MEYLAQGLLTPQSAPGLNSTDCLLDSKKPGPQGQVRDSRLCLKFHDTQAISYQRSAISF